VGRARGRAVLVTLVTAVAAGVLLWTASSDGEGRLAVAVRRLPPAPLVAREDASGVWTGTRFLVWGGHGASRTFADGASYDPATRTWTALPASPLRARTRHVAVWSGREMFVWGGTTKGSGVGGLLDGAAYDPHDRTWRTIAPAPAGSDRTYATGVWANGKIVIAGGVGPRFPTETSLLVYDTAHDTWRTVPAPTVDDDGMATSPSLPFHTVALAARGRFVFAAAVTSSMSPITIGVFRYDTRTDAMEQVWSWDPELEGSLQHVGLVFAGRRLVASATSLERGAVVVLPAPFQLVSGTVRTSRMFAGSQTFSPMRDGLLGATASHAYAFSMDGAAGFDLSTRHVQSATAGVDGFCGMNSTVVWTGRAFLAWGGQRCRVGGELFVATGIEVRPTR
jgi:hypothetical protein